MKDSSKHKLISVRVTGRMSREIDRLVGDSNKARPDVLREIILHGIRAYESALYERAPDAVSSSIFRRYHDWMLEDDDEAVEHLAMKLAAVEERLKHQDEKLESIANALTKKRGFFK